jgi:hypothetical protein
MGVPRKVRKDVVRTVVVAHHHHRGPVPAPPRRGVGIAHHADHAAIRRRDDGSTMRRRKVDARMPSRTIGPRRHPRAAPGDWAVSVDRRTTITHRVPLFLQDARRPREVLEARA